MYRAIICLIGVFLCANSVDAQIVFQSSFGGTEDENRLYGVSQTSDEGYIVTGYSESYSETEEPDAYTVRLDRYGNELWRKVVGEGGNDRGREIKQTDDGGYIMAGYTGSYAGDDLGVLAVWLVKYDEEGNVEWSKAYGGEGDDRAFDVEVANDGGFLVAGYSDSFNDNDEHDFYLLKTDEDGNKEWSNVYGGPQESRAYSVYPTNDGGYIMTGRSESFGPEGDDNVFLVKTDEDGDMEWSRAYGGDEEDRSYSVIQTHDDDFVIAGRSESYSEVAYDILVLRVQNDGTLDWSRTYGGLGEDIGRDVKQKENGELVIAAYGANAEGQDDMGYGLRLSPEGALISNTVYGGGPERDRCFSVDNTTDGGDVFGCYSENFAGELEYYVIKTDDQGFSGCNDQVDFTPTEANVGFRDEQDGVQRLDVVSEVEDLDVVSDDNPFHAFGRLCCIPKADFDSDINEEDQTASFEALTKDAESYGWEVNGDTLSQDPSLEYEFSDMDEVLEVCLSIEVSGCQEEPELSCQTVNLDNDLESPVISESDVNVYPNPSKGDFNIALENFGEDAVNVMLYNTAGSVVYSEEHSHLPGQDIEVQSEGLNSGLYLVEIRTSGQSIREKVRIE